jgi:DNA-binding PadR family transcriptional regulator
MPFPAFSGCGPRHGRHGAGDWSAMTGRHGAFGFGGPWGGFGRPGGPGWGRRGPRARRGDVRAAILVLLAEEPRNGYGLIQEIERRSGGVWRPSPGAVYPALQQLEDEGLVRAEQVEDRRTFRLTAEGERYVEEHRERLTAPWEAVSGAVGEGVLELRDLAGQVAAAVMQVAHAGSPGQLEEAKRTLADTRRALYRILAEGEPEERGEESPPS